MDKAEIRTKCLELALRYVEYDIDAARERQTYKNQYGVVDIAILFEQYVENGKR